MVHMIISVIYNILLNHCYNTGNTSAGMFNTKLHNIHIRKENMKKELQTMITTEGSNA